MFGGNLRALLAFALLSVDYTTSIGIPFRRGAAPASSKTYSAQEVKDAIKAGAYLVVLNGQVLDVTDFIDVNKDNSHPGGVDLITDMMGLDITKNFTDKMNNAGHPGVKVADQPIKIMGKFGSGDLGHTPVYPPGYAKAKSSSDDTSDDTSDDDSAASSISSGSVSNSQSTPTDADPVSSAALSPISSSSTSSIASTASSTNPSPSSSSVADNPQPQGSGPTIVYAWTSTVVVDHNGKTLGSSGSNTAVPGGPGVNPNGPGGPGGVGNGHRMKGIDGNTAVDDAPSSSSSASDESYNNDSQNDDSQNDDSQNDDSQDDDGNDKEDDHHDHHDHHHQKE